MKHSFNKLICSFVDHRWRRYKNGWISRFSLLLSPKGKSSPREKGVNFDRASKGRRNERHERKGQCRAVEEHTADEGEGKRARVVDDTTTGARVQPVVAWGEEGKVKAKHRRWKLAPCSRIGKRDAATWWTEVVDRRGREGEGKVV